MSFTTVSRATGVTFWWWPRSGSATGTPSRVTHFPLNLFCLLQSLPPCPISGSLHTEGKLEYVSAELGRHVSSGIGTDLPKCLLAPVTIVLESRDMVSEWVICMIMLEFHHEGNFINRPIG